MNLIKPSILLLVVSVLTGCANNMVLYKKDIAGLEFSSGTLPNTVSCKKLKRAYDSGLTRNLKKGIRWAEKEGGSHYQCNSHDLATCQNIYGRVTDLTKNDERILYTCMGDIRKEKLHKIKIQKSLKRDVTSKEISRRLASVEYKNIQAGKIIMDLNMYSLAQEIVKSVDVNDFKGLTVLGMKESPYANIKQNEYYSVLQVTQNRVYLTCGDKCDLPVIAIERVNERPSPIENVAYNDTKGVYMFLGTETYTSNRNRFGSVGYEIQALLFHRVTMSDLGLPNDYFKNNHNDLTSVD